MNDQPFRLPDIDPVVVRPIELGDLPRMLALCHEHAESVAHERQPYGVAQADTSELIEALFDTPRRLWAWVAESDDELVGYVSATVDFSILEQGYYVNLNYPFVRPTWQHVCVEPHLIERVQALAVNTGCLYIHYRRRTGRPTSRASMPHQARTASKWCGMCCLSRPANTLNRSWPRRPNRTSSLWKFLRGSNDQMRYSCSTLVSI